MPSAVSPPPSVHRGNGITKFTNCRLVRGDSLVEEDLWISSQTGKIIQSQVAFYDEYILPDQTIDLGGRIVSPGFIDCQLNGAFGFNFSTLFDDMSQYGKKLRDLNRDLIKTGVTSYIPTITSQTRELYHQVLPFLGPSGHLQDASDGAESLGAHVEGPFLSPTKNGVHNVSVLRTADSFADLEAMYDAANINPASSPSREAPRRPTPVKMLTAAPELGAMTALIPELTARGIVFSIGHSEATYEAASAAVAAGATMITHLFNAMRPLHHRNPGIFGVLGEAAGGGTDDGRAQRRPPPFFGVIADGIHLHPTTVKIAFNAHPAGFILVTDAMHMVGCPDGPYAWRNGDRDVRLVKNGKVLLLEGSDTIAGATVTLVECVENFLRWTGSSIPQALRAVTATPAAMLGLEGVKGSLDAGADADVVVLSEEKDEQGVRLVVDEVWKFGTRVHNRETL